MSFMCAGTSCMSCHCTAVRVKFLSAPLSEVMWLVAHNPHLVGGSQSTSGGREAACMDGTFTVISNVYYIL